MCSAWASDLPKVRKLCSIFCLAGIVEAWAGSGNLECYCYSKKPASLNVVVESSRLSTLSGHFRKQVFPSYPPLLSQFGTPLHHELRRQPLEPPQLRCTLKDWESFRPSLEWVAAGSAGGIASALSVRTSGAIGSHPGVAVPSPEAL